MSTAFASIDATLRDGRSVRIRAVLPSVEAELLQAFDRLNADTRCKRFMRAVNQPGERLRKTLAWFPARGRGIAATVPAADGIDIGVGAMFIVGSDPSTCAVAITVAADHGGAGLGRVGQ